LLLASLLLRLDLSVPIIVLRSAILVKLTFDDLAQTDTLSNLAIAPRISVLLIVVSVIAIIFLLLDRELSLFILDDANVLAYVQLDKLNHVVVAEAHRIDEHETVWVLSVEHLIKGVECHGLGAHSVLEKSIVAQCLSVHAHNSLAGAHAILIVELALCVRLHLVIDFIATSDDFRGDQAGDDGHVGEDSVDGRVLRIVDYKAGNHPIMVRRVNFD